MVIVSNGRNGTCPCINDGRIYWMIYWMIIDYFMDVLWTKLLMVDTC